MMRGSETVQGTQNLSCRWCGSLLEYTLVLDTISFTLLQGLPLWPRNGAAVEPGEQWKAREVAELVEPSPSMSQWHFLLFLSVIAVPSPPLHPNNSRFASLPSLFCLTKLIFLNQCRT